MTRRKHFSYAYTYTGYLLTWMREINFCTTQIIIKQKSIMASQIIEIQYKVRFSATEKYR